MHKRLTQNRGQLPISPPSPRPGQPNYAKRTQSRPANRQKKTANSKKTKRTQFPPTPACPTIQKCKTNPISRTPRCHPERRAAERNAAAQSRGICQNTIAEGDSNQTNPARAPKTRNEPNLHRSGPAGDENCETNPIDTPLARIYHPKGCAS